MPVSRQQIKAHQVCHSRQAPGFGCIQHSFYALTGATEILRNQRDASPYRFMLRAQHAGYLLWPLYCNPFATADDQFWRSLRDKAVNGQQREYRFIVTIQPGPRQHVFGMAADFHRNNLVISDPGHDALAGLTFEEFLRHHNYPRALEVLCVDSGEIDDYDEIM